MLRGRKPLPQSPKLVDHAAIDQLVADQGDDAANDRGIHFRAQAHLLADDLAQLLLNDRLASLESGSAVVTSAYTMPCSASIDSSKSW